MTIETIKTTTTDIDLNALPEKWVKRVQEVEWLRGVIGANFWCTDTYRHLKVTTKEGETLVSYNSLASEYTYRSKKEWLIKLAKCLQHDGYTTNQSGLTLKWAWVIEPKDEDRDERDNCDGRHGAGCADCCL